MALARLTDKPVVVVPPAHCIRPSTCAPPWWPWRALRAKPAPSSAALRSPFRAGLEIVVVHVHDEDSIPSFSDQVQHETEAYAQEFLSRHLIGGPQMRLELRLGLPAPEVLAAVVSVGAELVAVGWPRSDDPRRGAVAKEILEQSPVAVLLVAIA